MNALIVIPARYSSSRFPGKPLAQIAGKSLLHRVWSVASAVKSADRIVIATDDARIEAHAKSFGAEVVMTSESCANGSERVYEAMQKLGVKPNVVLNLQGDVPLTPPWVIEALLSAATRISNFEIITPAVRLGIEAHEQALKKLENSVSGTYVTISEAGRALYFSRFPIPFIRPDSKKNLGLTVPFFKHLGMYAYRPETLKRFIGLAATPLEKLEQLEQLRALENGIPIDVVEVNLRGRILVSIDTPEDAVEAEKIIQTTGDVL